MWSNFGKRNLCTPSQEGFLLVYSIDASGRHILSLHTYTKMPLFHLAMSRRRRQRAGWKYLNNDHSSAATVTNARDRRLNLCQLSVLRRPCAGEHPQISVFRHSLFSGKICFVTYVSSARIWIVASLPFFNKKLLSLLRITHKMNSATMCFDRSETDMIIGDWRCPSIWKEATKYQQDDDSGTAGCFSVEMYKRRS